MYYDIGTVSNRDIQLLYEYRILRHPSDYLTAIARTSTPQAVDKIEWETSERVLDAYPTIYQAELGVDVYPDLVPFLEFKPGSDESWKFIADFIDIEVTDNRLILYSANSEVNDLTINIYWAYSLRHISSMLEDILVSLEELAEDYAELESEIKNFKDTGNFQQRPTGLVTNLVKIANSDDQTGLVDSLYRVMTAGSNRLYVNTPQATLDSMEHIINESVEFKFLEYDHYVIEEFISPTILVSGTGDLVLKNLKGQVIITDWVGTVTVIDCSDVHIAAKDESSICQITNLQISRNSEVYLENYVHNIQNIEMYANSICRHWRANVRNISYIGPGCTYWCSAQVSIPGRIQLSEYQPDSNTVFDLNLHDILGTFCSDFNQMLIVGQHNLTPRLGNSDSEPEPSICVSKWSATYQGGNV